jgi:ubiquitin carboxyl-terminal hydrolase 7
VAWALQRLFYSLKSSTVPVSTQELTESLGWSAEKLFEKQDVQQLLRRLMELLEQRMKGTPVEHVLPYLFAGKVKSYISCINVDYMSLRIEEFWDIQLNTLNNRSLDDSFKEYIEVMLMDGDNPWDTRTAYGLQDARLGVIFERFPPVLHLELKRFQYDFSSHAMIKNQDYYEFPEEFDAGPYLSTDADKSEPWTYLLVGIIVHDGSIASGLYYSFQRPTKDGPFYRFSNDRVTRATLKEALDDNFGGENTELHGGIDARTLYGKGYPLKASRCATMLIYIRKSRLDQVLIDTALDDLLETPMDLPTDHHVRLL